MEYKIVIGDSKCCNCGKKIKKIIQIDGCNYGSECANNILGKNLSAPSWLFEIANKYVESKSDFETNVDDFVANFFSNDFGFDFECTGKNGESKVWSKVIKIDGKSVKIDWQFEVAEYLTKIHKNTRIQGGK